jgi:lactobin A/cerein 7B family class IIb bacteriocin
MSTSETSDIRQETNEIRELTSDELDAVNGGLVVTAIIAVLIGLLLPAVQ